MEPKEVLEKCSSDIQKMQNEIDTLFATSEDDTIEFKREIEGVSNKLSELTKELSDVSDRHREKLESRNSLLRNFRDALDNHTRSLNNYAEFIAAGNSRDRAAGEQPHNYPIPRCYSQPEQVRSPDTSSCLTVRVTPGTSRGMTEYMDSPAMCALKQQAEELRSELSTKKHTDEEVRRVYYQHQYPLVMHTPSDSPVDSRRAESSRLRRWKPSSADTVFVPSATSPLRPPKDEELKTELIEEYWQKPTEKRQFRYPYQVANGPNKELIVTDRENHHLLVFDENLNFLCTYGERGAGEGKFYNPTGLATDVDGGYLFVSDHNNLIQKFKIKQIAGASNVSLQCLFEYVDCYGRKGSETGELLFPCGLAWSKKGLGLFVCDYGNHRVQVFPLNKEQPYTFGRHGTGPGDFSEPHSIALNHDENKVFVSDHSNNRIQVFHPSGKCLKIITDSYVSPKPQLRYPRGIYYTDDDRVLVSCTYTHCILELTADGTYLSTIEGVIQPGGIVLRHDGKVVITSNVTQVLFVLTL